jgi:hypothetical protein
MAGLYAPLPTLRRRPRGRLRTDRGRRGLLLLHRSGLSPHTPCQSPGALTRVAACTLALSPIRDTLIEGFRHFVTSMPAPVASGWSESPGGACTHWKAPPCHGAHPLRTFGSVLRLILLLRQWDSRSQVVSPLRRGRNGVISGKITHCRVAE